MEIANQLPFDIASLEEIILSISDHFNIRVVFGEQQKALLMTTGLALIGGLLGRHYGGRMGAAVGGAVGGACGIGIAVVSMRDIWQDIKGQLLLSDLYKIVHDQLLNFGIQDYYTAAVFLTTHASDKEKLAKLIVSVVSKNIGKQLLTSINTI